MSLTAFQPPPLAPGSILPAPTPVKGTAPSTAPIPFGHGLRPPLTSVGPARWLGAVGQGEKMPFAQNGHPSIVPVGAGRLVDPRGLASFTPARLSKSTRRAPSSSRLWRIARRCRFRIAPTSADQTKNPQNAGWHAGESRVISRLHRCLGTYQSFD